VPEGTQLHSAVLDGQGTLSVNVTAPLLGAAGAVLADAVAQIVLTASRAGGVRRVRLLVDGEPQDWPTGSGASTRDPLSIYDFRDFLPVTALDGSTGAVVGP
jgi:spore germination protein GerM